MQLRSSTVTANRPTAALLYESPTIVNTSPQPIASQPLALLQPKPRRQELLSRLGEMSTRGRKARGASVPRLNTASSEGRGELACSCLALCLDKIISYVRRMETEDSTLKSGVLVTDPCSLTFFFPEFFKTARPPELKLRNFATKRDLQKLHHFRRCQRQVKRAPVDSCLLCRNKICLDDSEVPSAVSSLLPTYHRN